MEEVMKMRAGVGLCQAVYPTKYFPFQEGPDLWSGIHDNPYVRVLILDCGMPFAIVSMEVVILDRFLDTYAREKLEEIAGIPKENAWITTTHTVTAPHLFVRDEEPPEERDRSIDFRSRTVEALDKAIKMAADNMQDATIGFGCGSCAVNVNRVVNTKDGWWLGSGEELPSDRSVPVIRINGADGEMIAVLYNYATELAVMDKSIMSDGGRHITSDLSGVASRFVEELYDDKAVAIFLPGTGIDQGPIYRAKRLVRLRNGDYKEIDLQEKGWLLLELLGERLGEQVLVTSEQIECHTPKKPLAVTWQTDWYQGQWSSHGSPRPSDGPVKEWPFKLTEPVTKTTEALVIDDSVLICAAGTGVRTVLKIKENSPFENTIVVGGVSGMAPRLKTEGGKGMPEKDLYDKVSFQGRNTGFAPGSAEKYAEDMHAFLEKLWAENHDKSI